jgi:hypothetical protein
MQFFVDVLVPAVLVAAGIAHCVWALDQRARTKASTRWPHVVGQITAARVEPAAALPNVPVGSKDRYAVIVEYTYKVNGRRYVGNRERFGLRTVDTRAAAEAELRRYPPGAAIQIWYDPRDPQQSVRARGDTSPPFPPAFWRGLAFSACGCLVAWVI